MYVCHLRPWCSVIKALPPQMFVRCRCLVSVSDYFKLWKPSWLWNALNAGCCHVWRLYTSKARLQRLKVLHRITCRGGYGWPLGPQNWGCWHLEMVFCFEGWRTWWWSYWEAGVRLVWVLIWLTLASFVRSWSSTAECQDKLKLLANHALAFPIWLQELEQRYWGSACAGLVGFAYRVCWLRYKKCLLLHSTHLRILTLDIMLGIEWSVRNAR